MQAAGARDVVAGDDEVLLLDGEGQGLEGGGAGFDDRGVETIVVLWGVQLRRPPSEGVERLVRRTKWRMMRWVRGRGGNMKSSTEWDCSWWMKGM